MIFFHLKYKNFLRLSSYLRNVTFTSFKWLVPKGLVAVFENQFLVWKLNSIKQFLFSKIKIKIFD